MKKQNKHIIPLAAAVCMVAAVITTVVLLNARNERIAAEQERTYSDMAQEIADFAESP